MEVIEVVLVVGAIAAGLGASLGAPVSFGVFVRTGARVNYANLPRSLRIVYSFFDVDLPVAGDKKSCNYPELYTFVPVIIIAGYFVVQILSTFGSAPIEDSSYIERSYSGIVVIVFLLVSWAVTTLGIEAWLYYKWIPLNLIDENRTSE